MSQSDSLQSEITAWERRLQLRREQKAKLGISADPSIDIEIEEIEAKLQTLYAGSPQPPASALPSRSPAATVSSTNPTHATNTSGKSRLFWNILTIIVAIATVISAVVAVRSCQSSVPPTPTPDRFTFLVKVQDRDTGESLENAEVTLDLPGTPPKNGYTDANGIARFLLETRFQGQPATLTVELDNYPKYTQAIELAGGELPFEVKLKPGT